MALSDDLKKPAFPFIEIAYVALFCHAIGLNYFFVGLSFTSMPEHRLKDFAHTDDQTIVFWAWFGGFGLFLLASSYQLLRVYLRVILSDQLDKKHHALGLACADFRMQSSVLFLHYTLRLAAILLLLFIEKSLHEPWASEVPTAFFQRWSRVLLYFYCILLAYSICVSTFKASWSASIIRSAKLQFGRPWEKPRASDPAVVTQAREAFWQSIGWFVTDLVVFVAYGLMFWISNPEGGQAMSSLRVLLSLALCGVFSISVFLLEIIGPLIEDVKTMLHEYSRVKTALALVFAFVVWLGAAKFIGSLLT